MILFWSTAAPLALAMPGENCIPLLGNVAFEETEAFLRNNQGFKSPANNREFRRQSQNRAGLIFFHVENAVLKKLNDQGVRDKTITGGLEALYSRVFFEALNKMVVAEPRLRPTATYSDYKSIRLAIPDFIGAETVLSKLNAKVAERFHEELSRYSGIMAFLDKSCSGCGFAKQWHVGGVGSSAEQAAARARLAREQIKPKDTTDPHLPEAILYGAGEENGRLNSGIKEVESDRKKLQQYWETLFGHENPLLTRSSLRDSVALPSHEVIELYRRYSDLAEAEFVDAMEKAIPIRFGVQLSEVDRVAFRNSILQFKKYLASLDPYMPAIYEPSEVLDLGHARGDHELIAVDLAGQNARNLFQAMLAMSEGVLADVEPAHRLDEVFKLTRKHQDIASQEFIERREKFTEALKVVDPEADVIFSGDDGTYSPKEHMTKEKRDKLISTLAGLSVPADFRLIFIHPKNRDDGQLLAPKRKATLVTLVENLEKRLRRKLEGEVPYRQLKDVLFAMDVRPISTGKSEVNLIISGRANEALVNKIKEVFLNTLPPMVEPGEIRFLPETQPLGFSWPPVAISLAA